MRRSRKEHYSRLLDVKKIFTKIRKATSPSLRKLENLERLVGTNFGAENEQPTLKSRRVGVFVVAACVTKNPPGAFRRAGIRGSEVAH